MGTCGEEEGEGRREIERAPGPSNASIFGGLTRPVLAGTVLNMNKAVSIPHTGVCMQIGSHP